MSQSWSADPTQLLWQAGDPQVPMAAMTGLTDLMGALHSMNHFGYGCWHLKQKTIC